MKVARCEWAGEEPGMVAYHDEEWGVPSHDERHLFELLSLEGAQAGLSWSTILRKRPGYREAFAGFDPEAVARFGARDVARLMLNQRIVRNRAKIESTVENARAILRLHERGDDLDGFVWRLVEGTPVINRWRGLEDIPAQTDTSGRMSRELKQHGFRFVGPTTCYAFMQAAGLVNDHVVSCFRYLPVAKTDGGRIGSGPP